MRTQRYRFAATRALVPASWVLGHESAGTATVIDGSGQFLQLCSCARRRFMASRAKFALTLHLPVWVIEMPCLNDPSLSSFSRVTTTVKAMEPRAAQLKTCSRSASASRCGLCQCRFRDSIHRYPQSACASTDALWVEEVVLLDCSSALSAKMIFRSVN